MEDLLSWQQRMADQPWPPRVSSSATAPPLPAVRASASMTWEPATPRTFEARSSQASLAAAAAAAKDRGNALFSRGDFDGAYIAYSEAIRVDASVAAYFTNRALAALKLGRFADCEADCSSALALEPRNLKAVWRRGTCRAEMGKLDEAIEDLTYARVLDPADAALRGDLQRIERKRVEAKAAAAAAAAARPKQTAKSAATSPRRRIPVEEVSDEEPDAPLNAAATAAAAAPPPSSTSVKPSGPLVQELAPVDDKSKPSEAPTSARVPSTDDSPTALSQAGGHSEAATKAALAAVPVSAAPAAVPVSAAPAASAAGEDWSGPPPALRAAVPATSFDLEKVWRSIRADDGQLYALLCAIPTDRLPAVFNEALDADRLWRILQIVRRCILPCAPIASLSTAALTIIFVRRRNQSPDYTAALLTALSRLKRFDMAIMFFSATQKDFVRALLDAPAIADATRPLRATFRV